MVMMGIEGSCYSVLYFRD